MKQKSLFKIFLALLAVFTFYASGCGGATGSGSGSDSGGGSSGSGNVTGRGQ